MIFSEFLLKIVLFSSISTTYQHQPQEIQQNEYYRKYKCLLHRHLLASYHHQTMIKNTADTSAFHRSDKKSA